MALPAVICYSARARMNFLKAVPFTHELVRSVVNPGAVVVDATAGNGHDALFLARLVSPGGQVHAFDIQEAAVAATRRRLVEAGLESVLHLHHRGHEEMEGVLVERGLAGDVAAVMFNLGYLPGGDRDVITRVGTTLRAAEAALEMLAPGGIMTVALYTGHPGGREEAEAMAGFCRGLDQDRFHALRYGFLNLRNDPPHVIAVEKA